MSRTDKDRPYWVRLKDEGVMVHDHQARSYRNRRGYNIEKVFDDEGNPVMETREVKLTAKRVIETQPRMKEVPYTAEVLWGNERDGFYTRLWNGVSKRLANPAYSEAARLVSLGMPDAMVTIRTETVQKTEKVYPPAPDPDTICDAEEALADPKNPWGYRCSMEIPYWSRNYYRCRCSWCRPGDEPRQRNRKRTFVTAMRKRANSGDEDWEDEFNELDLSQPDMYHRGWC
ncbi:hypothetical protein SEA_PAULODIABOLI_176 [Microbacterium phage PauloDiaboli]|nr:hypothetical protein SEA_PAULODIABOLI_176 [Microbacterium phage PauloDiaboli]QWY83989.1 hypothetical protein SEA_A3WALLY_176 [Microbacterium phage A3Wally]